MSGGGCPVAPPFGESYKFSRKIFGRDYARKVAAKTPTKQQATYRGLAGSGSDCLVGFRIGYRVFGRYARYFHKQGMYTRALGVPWPL